MVRARERGPRTDASFVLATVERPSPPEAPERVGNTERVLSLFNNKVNKQLVAPHDRREPRTRARDEAEEDSVRAWRSRSIDGRVRARARVEVRVGVVVRVRVRASVRIRSVCARPPGHGQLHLMRVRVRVG